MSPCPGGKFEHELMKEEPYMNSIMKGKTVRKAGKERRRPDKVPGAFTGRGLYGRNVYMKGKIILRARRHEHE